MSQELVLSASSITTFLRCGQQWYLIYVQGIRNPPSLRAIRGVAIHKAVEVDMTQKVESWADLPVSDMLDAYDTSWNEGVDLGFTEDDADKPGEVKDRGYMLVQKYRAEVAPRIQPWVVEKPIQFKIQDQPYSGQIDIGERRYNPQKGHSELIVRDTKSTRRSPRPNQYLMNMTGYAISQRQATGEVEADIVYDYLVATKEPQYKEIRMGGPITDDQIRKFSNIVSSVAGDIKAGRFPPNGLVSGACSWCGVRQFCPVAPDL